MAARRPSRARTAGRSLRRRIRARRSRSTSAAGFGRGSRRVPDAPRSHGPAPLPATAADPPRSRTPPAARARRPRSGSRRSSRLRDGIADEVCCETRRPSAVARRAAPACRGWNPGMTCARRAAMASSCAWACCDRRPLLQTADHGEASVAPLVRVVAPRQRGPDFDERAEIEAVESFRGDTDDRHGLTIHRDLGANSRRRPGKCALPQPIPDDSDRRRPVGIRSRDHAPRSGAAAPAARRTRPTRSSSATRSRLLPMRSDAIGPWTNAASPRKAVASDLIDT